MTRVVTSEFRYEGHRLVYDDFGGGRRPLVLLSGLLLPRTMQHSLAESLAASGNRVICLDLLGHGDSDRPAEMTNYSIGQFADQVIALLDHLGLDDTVVGGTSLGANVTLEVCVRAPERLRGALVEMPVLDSALVACAVAFTPLLVAFTAGAPLTRAVGRLARLVPRGLTRIGDVGLTAISQDPAPSAAVLEGLFFGRIAPPRRERERIETPALVIGHTRDPVHPFSDSDMLVRELRRARLVQANSILELRLTPQRLTGEIARFLDERWRPAAAGGRGATASAGRRA